MDQYDVIRLTLMEAIKAEIEGMKIYNLKYPDTAGYDEQAFMAKAEELRILASKHNEQL